MHQATTFKNRQNTSTPVVGTGNLTQSFAKINIGSPISSKKVTPQSPEFVPGQRTVGVSSASASPNFFNSFPGLAGTAAVVPGYNRDSPHSSTASPRITPQPSPPPSHALNNCSPTSFGSAEKPTTYQENVGGTTYFYQASGGDSISHTSSDSLQAGVHSNNSGGVSGVSGGATTYQAYPGTPSHLASLKPAKGAVAPSTSFFVSEDMRQEIMNKNALTLMHHEPEQFPDLPHEVDNYHELVPLEPLPTGPLHKAQLPGYPTSTYKATNIKTGVRYCLRRVHGFRLQNTKCMLIVDMWKRIHHSNIVQLKEVFTTKAFGDNSIIFVYDYHPGSETLLTKHFSQSENLNGYTDPFSSDPNAPRPYSHQKNTLLRQQQSNKLPEPVIWNYIIQLTSALRIIHAAGLACRALDPTKIILTGRSRLRLSCLCITDVITYDNNASTSALVPHYQQEDLCALGKLVLALACKSLIAVQRENIQTSLELVARTYTPDLRNLIMYLLSNQQRRTVTDLMPMIGARFYTQLDILQLRTDLMENEIAKEMENGRVFRLLVKLCTINERPELNMDGAWAETGDRYMLKLFRDYVFHQVTEDGRPWLDMAHVVQCLNKLDAGVPEKVCLMSRDEQSILVVSYAELKHCLEQSFEEILTSASGGSGDPIS
ncbi:Poly(A) specific ribonuclease subunit PAN3 [Carabus blaptoides fortunei]